MTDALRHAGESGTRVISVFPGGGSAMLDLSPRAREALRRFAEDGDWNHVAMDGLRVLDRPLRDSQAVAVSRRGDELWVIVDLRRPDALAQLRALIDSWPIDLRRPFRRLPQFGALGA